MKERELQKSRFPNCLVNWEKLRSTDHANIPKSQFSIFSMNWENLRAPVGATFKNSNFQSLCKLGKTKEYNVSPRF